MKETNGYARILLYHGNGNPDKELTQRARITEKLVKTSTRTWDHKGNRVSAYFSGMRRATLLAFAKDGGSETVLLTARTEERTE
jgi:hypothetical protein